MSVCLIWTYLQLDGGSSKNYELASPAIACFPDVTIDSLVSTACPITIMRSGFHSSDRENDPRSPGPPRHDTVVNFGFSVVPGMRTCLFLVRHA